MIRFSSSIRFITRDEWAKLPLNEFTSVQSWDMHAADQWIPSRQADTYSMAPCIAGGLTAIQTDPLTQQRQGLVGLSHLIPVYHYKRADKRSLIGYLTASGKTMRQQTPLAEQPVRLKGLFVGGATRNAHSLWPTICRGVNKALGFNGLRHAFQNILAYTGHVSPALAPPVSAFIGQRYEGLSHMAYDGTKDTWYVIASQNDATVERWQVVRSASTLRQFFQFRQVAPDDQVFMGLDSTTPVPSADLVGSTLQPYKPDDPGWAYEPMASGAGTSGPYMDLNDGITLRFRTLDNASTRALPGERQTPHDTNESLKKHRPEGPRW